MRRRRRRVEVDGSSGFITDLFQVANEGDLSLSPIDLDAPSTAVRFFVSLVYSDYQPFLDMSTSETESALIICDYLRSPSIERTILQAMRSSGLSKNPWAVFRVASQRQDIPLAKAAIGQMGLNDGPATRLPHLKAGDLDGVRPDWFVELLGKRFGKSMDGRSLIVCDWGTVAKGFDPKVA